MHDGTIKEMDGRERSAPARLEINFWRVAKRKKVVEV
jgi:hypothetical protein